MHNKGENMAITTKNIVNTYPEEKPSLPQMAYLDMAKLFIMRGEIEVAKILLRKVSGK